MDWIASVMAAANDAEMAADAANVFWIEAKEALVEATAAEADAMDAASEAAAAVEAFKEACVWKSDPGALAASAKAKAAYETAVVAANKALSASVKALAARDAVASSLGDTAAAAAAEIVAALSSAPSPHGDARIARLQANLSNFNSMVDGTKEKEKEALVAVAKTTAAAEAVTAAVEKAATAVNVAAVDTQLFAELPFPCFSLGCKERFGVKKKRKKHMKKRHKDLEKVCECGGRFDDRAKLMKHCQVLEHSPPRKK